MANLKMTHLRNHSSWKKKKTKQTCIKIACSTKTMIDQNVVIHQWLFFQNPRAWGTGFKWTKGEWSIREHGSITIGIAFMKTSSFFWGEGGGGRYSPKILFGRHFGKSTSGKPVIWNSGDNRSTTNKTSLTNYFSSFSSLLWENWFPYFSSPISENGSFCSFSGYFSFSSLAGDSVIKSLQVRPKRSELWLQRAVYLE